ncbi:MAG: hypothetical protein Q4F85_16820 [Prevotella sp.]|nr:hypothetical protein [Prevotella sp.]
MRKNIIALCLMALFAQSVNAQGFFKKLGKALKESAQTIVTGGAVTQETKWGNITVKHLIPNMTVSVQNVERNGDNLAVTLLFTNTSSQKMQLWDLRSRKIFDSQGTQYNSSCMVGNEWLTIGDSYNYFESQVPTKVVCSFGAVPTSSFVVSMIKFETSYISDGKRYETPLEIRNITVPEYKPAAVTTSAVTSNIFKGGWGKEFPSDKAGISLELYGIQKKVEDYDKPVYGTISSYRNNGSRIDDDYITKMSVNGNTATIEYECGRAMDEDFNPGIGKAQLTINPQTKAMTIKVISYPKGTSDGCYVLDGVTMAKDK